jgi:amidase
LAGNSLVHLTAQQIAQAIRERKASTIEVVQAHLAHIAQHNSALNAIVTLDEERALDRAKVADAALARGEIWGPLHGVPVTIKDVYETAGLRTTSSFYLLARYVPKQDATVVARLRAAGAVILGKTNMPMLAVDIQTNSPLFGRANNPWNLGRTTGGSTGGGAAAVAAGLSPLEVGSDMGGSIRIPAHFNGVFGFKPTEHRVPATGHIPDLPGAPRVMRHMCCFGPLARSVEDLRLCFTLIAGPDGKDLDVLPVPLDAPPERPLRQMRFAWMDDFGGAPVTAETRAALARLADSLADLGCCVERAGPPGFDYASAWRTYSEILGTMIGAIIPAPMRLLGRLAMPLLHMNEPTMRSLTRGFKLNARQYMEALARRDALIEQMERFLGDWDAWLCPVAPTPAFSHRRSGLVRPGRPIEVDGHKVPYWRGSISYAVVFNLLGNPVVVLPLSRSSEGLPIGVQVVGRRWRDMELLAVAGQLAEVTKPFQFPPGY